MNIDEWKSQIKRGTLEYSILLMIQAHSSYGYEIIISKGKHGLPAAAAVIKRRILNILVAGNSRRLTAQKVLHHHRHRQKIPGCHVRGMGQFNFSNQKNKRRIKLWIRF